MTTILAFDTATAACSAALSIDGEINQLFKVAPRRHTELLLPMIDRLLQDASLKLSDCDAIAFGQGPGSFMGLRIAAGVAQGLAFGANLPVVPISSLQALAQEAHWQTASKTVLAGWDARMEQIYWGIYQANQNRMEAVTPDQLSVPESIDCSNENTLAAGNAWQVYKKNLPKNIVELAHPKKDCYPSAKAIAYLAQNLVEQGQAIPPQDIELSYLRNKVAEVPNA